MGAYERIGGRFLAVLVLAALLLLAGGCNGADDDVDCEDFTVQPLQVRRHTSTSLTNARASQVLADASNVLQTDDGANDIACCVTL